MEQEYKLRYLPLFYEDANEAVHYIRDTLKNPSAAMRLLDAMEKAILERLPSAESFMKYQSKTKRDIPYYSIRVRNFTIFYVVLEENGSKIMEVRRFLYSKRDMSELL